MTTRHSRDLTPAEAAERLGVNRWRVYQLIYAGLEKFAAKPRLPGNPHR